MRGARISGNRQTHIWDNYSNPRCACASRVNYGGIVTGHRAVSSCESDLSLSIKLPVDPSESWPLCAVEVKYDAADYPVLCTQ